MFLPNRNQVKTSTIRNEYYAQQITGKLITIFKNEKSVIKQ